MPEPEQEIEPGDDAMSLNPDSRGVTGRVVRICGAITAGAGVLALVGWALNWDTLKAMGPNYIPTAPNTALLFALLGSAVLAREVWPASLAIHRAATAAGLFSAVVAGVTLTGFATGLNIDDWLFITTRMFGAVPIGRMSPITAFCFILAGVSLLLLECRARTWAAIPGALITLVGAVCLMGYLFGAPLLYGGTVIPVALPTSLAFMALGVGLIAAAGSDAWPLNTLIGPSTSAQLLRTLLPTVVALALINSWITAVLLEHAGPDLVLAAAITAISFLLVVGLVVSRVSRPIGDAIDRTNAERKRAVEAVRESEAKLRTIFEGALDGILVADTETGKFLSGNPAICRMLGYTLEEVLCIGVPDIHPKQDVPRAMKQFESLLRGESEMAADMPMMRKDGSVFYADIKAAPIRIGGKDGLLGIFRDITERRNQEQKITRLSRIRVVMSAINSLIVRVRDRQELFNESCRIAVEQGGFGIAWIGVLNQVTLEITPAACAGIDVESFLARGQNTARPDTSLSQNLANRAIREKRAMFSNDLTKEAGVGGERRKEAIRRGYSSAIALPLLMEEAVVGNLSLFAKEANFFTAEEMTLLTELSGEISFALQSIARQEKLDKLSRIRAVSGEINTAIVRIREREQLLKETCRVAVEHGKFELVWIGALDAEKQEVRPVAWAGFSPDAAGSVSWATINAARGTLAEAIRTRRAVINNDIDISVQRGGLRQEAMEKGCFSTVSMPLVVDDKVVALCALFAPGQGFFVAEELALLDELAADVSFALAYIAKEEKLNYLAYYDVLTGLPNRALFDDRMTQVLRAASHEKSRTALVLVDLERFQGINDTLGRSAADEILKLVAQRLQSVIFDRDSLARIHADVFAALFPGIKDEADIARLVEEKIIGCLNRPFTLAGQEVRVSAKAGVALFPGDATEPDLLFSNAEAALRQAKDSSDRYLFYARKMNAFVAERLKLENRLQRALELEQFVLFYQPKVDLGTGRVAGLEALIRWNDPGSGLVMPMLFIPLLEETGMIVEVGAWAMKQAVSQFAAWQAAGIEPPPIAVNVSQVQLKRKDFFTSVQQAIAIAGQPGHGLALEITESMIMEDIEASIEKLTMVRDLGVGISIDDFGTGHSSLRYLTRLPITALKIDRAFIQHMATNADD
ncbi:MAG: EAL domain-containing protein, partial [Betaproteobacteria bacterium]|nr:EAL domain-containing protein [Betaproteobacteria bacterium]